jgi:protein phosphatase 4 regulatory subunit 3
LIGLQDEFYIKHLTEKQVLGPVLEVLIQTMPRDNLLSSACLEFFEFIKKENIKDLVKHLVQNHRERLVTLSYMETFRDLILRYDQTQGYTANMDYFLDTEDEVGRRPTNANARLIEQLPVDPTDEEYWNTSDDEEDQQAKAAEKASTNGATPSSKPLVDYPSDEEVDENADPEALATAEEAKEKISVISDSVLTASRTSPVATPPERVSEKRRREEDEEDELGKLMQSKRRNSSSAGSNASATSGGLRKKKSFTGNSANAVPKKIAISISSTVKTGGGTRSDDDS